MSPGRSRSVKTGTKNRVSPQVSVPVFAVSAAILVTASTLAEQAGGMDWLRLPTARASHAVVSALGFHTTLLGCEIFTSSKILDVAVTCIPSGVFAVFLALVIATRASGLQRMAGVGFGAVMLFSANVARVVAGVVVAQAAPGVFDYVHSVVLQVIPVTFAFLAWLLWARWSHAL